MHIINSMSRICHNPEVTGVFMNNYIFNEGKAGRAPVALYNIEKHFVMHVFQYIRSPGSTVKVISLFVGLSVKRTDELILKKHVVLSFDNVYPYHKQVKTTPHLIVEQAGKWIPDGESCAATQNLGKLEIY